MFFVRAFKVALTALSANKLRSTLAVLGIVIGVGAVIAMVAMGKGAQVKIEEGITKMGVNMIFVYPGAVSKGASGAKTSSAETLCLEDCDAIAKIEHVAAVAPEVRRTYQIKYMNRNEAAQVIGTTPSHLQIRNFSVEHGAYFDKSAILGRLRVCVMGASIARKLFGGIDPIGRMIQIDRKNFQVLGVLEDKGGDSWVGLDDSVYVPVTTALHRLFNRRHLSQITISVDTQENIDSTMNLVDDEMMKQHKIKGKAEPDFLVRSMNEWRQRAAESTGALTVLLMGIALVSLLVGGIGIMNIMLVSVTERTREIGIRKAIGAKRRDILKQFLIESMTISLLGGTLGIAFGVALAQIIPMLPVWKQMSNGGEWQSVISPWSIVVSFGFSCFVGIFFGLYPAVKASRLNPVEALRYE
ncbi:MAG TPA: ABC transporter permease [Planctomycetota bacterium]|nr:ABC transporter permease [Planctomycetota bacterium]